MTFNQIENANGNDVIQQTSETELNNTNGKAPRRPRKPRYKRGPKPSGEQQQDGAQDGVPESPQETVEVGHKVFVGNLPFSITEEELFEYFTQAGQVLNATVIKRFGRPRGYGFVTFESEGMADKAISMLDKTTCAERVINVETTKHHTERTSRPKGSRRGGRGQIRGRGGRQHRTARHAEGEQVVEESQLAEVEDGQNIESHTEVESSQRERPKRNRPSRRRQAPPANVLPSEETGVETPEGEDAEAPEPKPRVRKPRVRKPRMDNGEAPGERRPRRPQGPPSETSLFVANLPFNMNDTGLEELFKDFKISSAHVIIRKGSDRNKGFGFVELADHDEQQRVLGALEVSGPLTVDGRDLSIKVALQEYQEEGVGMADEQGHPEPARIDSE